MADVQLSSRKGNKNKAPRIDLTPMVDLGFILITFFIYTTTIAEPKVMDINMPYKPAKEVTAYADTSTLTIIPMGNGKALYYAGENINNMSFVSFPEMRTLITEKKNALRQLPTSFSADAHRLHVIIKPDNSCNYETLVRVMDEMLINNVPHYAITDLTETERNEISKH